jgi:hypothetical protein
MDEWHPLTLKRLAFVPFLLQQWIVLLWAARSSRVRRILLQPRASLRHFAITAVLLSSLAVGMSGYLWLNRSIVGPHSREHDPVLSLMSVVQHIALAVAAIVLAKRVYAYAPLPPKATPRLLLLLLVVWVVVFGSLTAISIGPLAVLPVSRRDGLIMAAGTVLGTLPLALFLWLTVRQKRKDAATPPR